MALSEALQVAGDADESFRYQTEAAELASTVDVDLLNTDSEHGSPSPDSQPANTRLVDTDHTEPVETVPESVIREEVESLIDQLGSSDHVTLMTSDDISDAERYLHETVNETAPAVHTLGRHATLPATRRPTTAAHRVPTSPSPNESNSTSGPSSLRTSVDSRLQSPATKTLTSTSCSLTTNKPTIVPACQADNHLDQTACSTKPRQLNGNPPTRLTDCCNTSTHQAVVNGDTKIRHELQLTETQDASREEWVTYEEVIDTPAAILSTIQR